MSNNQRRIDTLNEFITKVDEASPLDCWTAFIEEMQVPREIALAIHTGRPELLALAKPRALSEAECKILYDLIGNLIRTNVALRQHAEHTATMVENWATAFKGLRRIGDDIVEFANFRSVKDARIAKEDEDEAA